MDLQARKKSPTTTMHHEKPTTPSRVRKSVVLKQPNIFHSDSTKTSHGNTKTPTTKSNEPFNWQRQNTANQESPFYKSFKRRKSDFSEMVVPSIKEEANSGVSKEILGKGDWIFVLINHFINDLRLVIIRRLHVIEFLFTSILVGRRYSDGPRIMGSSRIGRIRGRTSTATAACDSFVYDYDVGAFKVREIVGLYTNLAM